MREAGRCHLSRARSSRASLRPLDCNALTQLVDKEMALPGEDATVKLKMLKPMAMEEGQSFTIRDNNDTFETGEREKYRT